MSEQIEPRYDPKWEEDAMNMPPMMCGRLDMDSYTMNGEPEKYVYVEGSERTQILGPWCDEIAYAAQRFKPLKAQLSTVTAQRDAAVEALKIADAWFTEQDDNDTHAQVVRAAIAAAGGSTLANAPHDHDHIEAKEQG